MKGRGALFRSRALIFIPANGCSGQPGEVPDNEVNAHLGNPGGGVPIPRPPQPLLHTKLTINPPWDTLFGDPTPVTLEVVILADGTYKDDVTAGPGGF